MVKIISKLFIFVAATKKYKFRSKNLSNVDKNISETDSCNTSDLEIANKQPKPSLVSISNFIVCIF